MVAQRDNPLNRNRNIGLPPKVRTQNRTYDHPINWKDTHPQTARAYPQLSRPPEPKGRPIFHYANEQITIQIVRRYATRVTISRQGLQTSHTWPRYLAVYIHLPYTYMRAGFPMVIQSARRYDQNVFYNIKIKITGEYGQCISI